MSNLSFMYFVLILALLSPGAFSTVFTFHNNCRFSIWPATLSGATSAPLPTTGFVLNAGASQTLQAPPNWSGRMWARRECTVDGTTGRFSCLSGDCGSGIVKCNGAGGELPSSLVEFTLNGADGKDFYDVSLVDGYNLPVSIKPQNINGCNSTTCDTDINLLCPPELQLKDSSGNYVIGCKSACAALGGDQYCCAGAFNDPHICKPSEYSLVFKNACPQAYSYPYDDATSTFTCIGADYLVTFCP